MYTSNRPYIWALLNKFLIIKLIMVIIKQIRQGIVLKNELPSATQVCKQSKQLLFETNLFLTLSDYNCFHLI